MARFLQLSKVKVHKEPGNSKIKRARFVDFPDSGEVRMGIHGGISEFFKAHRDGPLPSTLDYVVAALAGCMTGTVAGALGARGISGDPDKLETLAEGRIEEVDGKMLLTHISLRYRLKVPKDKRASVERALEHHEARCAVSESLRHGITIEWQSEIEEEPASGAQPETVAASATPSGKS